MILGMIKRWKAKCFSPEIAIFMANCNPCNYWCDVDDFCYKSKWIGKISSVLQCIFYFYKIWNGFVRNLLLVENLIVKLNFTTIPDFHNFENFLQFKIVKLNSQIWKKKLWQIFFLYGRQLFLIKKEKKSEFVLYKFQKISKLFSNLFVYFIYNLFVATCYFKIVTKFLTFL